MSVTVKGQTIEMTKLTLRLDRFAVRICLLRENVLD
jgi:hypothetical protein